MIEDEPSDVAGREGPWLGDAWGALLLACLEAGMVPGAVLELIERDDGFLGGADAVRYFAGPDDWGTLDRLACAEARGRILDVGAGAGRAALYLQETGRDAVALDVSAGAVDVCQRRGIRQTVIGTVEDLADAGGGPFDTFLLLGNNLGLLGSAAQAPRFLNALARLAAADAVILGQGVDPYQTSNEVHRAYHQRNRALGRLPGQIRMRVRHQNLATPWFDYLLTAVDELRALLDGTAWTLERYETAGAGYLAVLHPRH
ncbi:MAG: class I SAM-dependent methyltransferase [Chloroflexota bacterium]|nr:class I SAM-dependent methyltransferase [Chloroflexota bacterium]